MGEHGFGPAPPLDTVNAPILKPSAFGRGWDLGASVHGGAEGRAGDAPLLPKWLITMGLRQKNRFNECKECGCEPANNHTCPRFGLQLPIRMAVAGPVAATKGPEALTEGPEEACLGTLAAQSITLDCCRAESQRHWEADGPCLSDSREHSMESMTYEMAEPLSAAKLESAMVDTGPTETA